MRERACQAVPNVGLRYLKPLDIDLMEHLSEGHDHD